MGTSYPGPGLGGPGLKGARKSSGFRVKFWYRTHERILEGQLAMAKNFLLFTIIWATEFQ